MRTGRKGRLGRLAKARAAADWARDYPAARHRAELRTTVKLAERLIQDLPQEARGRAFENAVRWGEKAKAELAALGDNPKLSDRDAKLLFAGYYGSQLREQIIRDIRKLSDMVKRCEEGYVPNFADASTMQLWAWSIAQKRKQGAAAGQTEASPAAE